MENKTVVYRHRKATTGEVFYVGIGQDPRRPYKRCQRTALWHRYVNKYDYTVEIIAENLSREDACELEMLLISEYGRLKIDEGGILVNRTLGGEGTMGCTWNIGRKCSDETKAKIGKANKGKYDQKVIHTETGIIYSSKKEAAKLLNIKYGTLKSWFSRGKNEEKAKLRLYEN